MDAMFLDFLNSDWHDYRGTGHSEDRLEDGAWVRQFLARWGLSSEAELSVAERAELGALRTRLRRMVETLEAGQTLDAADLRALDETLATAPLVRRLSGGPDTLQLGLTPLQRTWAWVRGEIVASFVEMLSHGDTQRLKICENADCRWVFYDESKSRTRRWCEPECGNLIKVRRFRERQRSATAK